MAGARCACGFKEVAGVDETISDHLLAVFTPEDGTGPDGLVHLEGETDLSCLCGAGGSVADLDAHFLAVFTPTDHIGRDGQKHYLVSGGPALDDR